MNPELPEAPAAGLEPVNVGALLVVVTTQDIWFDGAPILSLTNGEIGANDLEATATRMRIPKLSVAYEPQAPYKSDIRIAADERASMRTIDAIMGSFTPFPVPQTFRIMVRAEDSKRTMALPIDFEADEHVVPRGKAKHYRPIVAIGDGKLSLMSTSEGRTPSLVTEDASAVIDALDKEARRRWPKGKRGHDDDKLLLRVAPMTRLGAVVPFAAPARAAHLYSHVLLWWPGFDEPEESDAADREAAFANVMTMEGSDTLGSDAPRRPGADLARQIEDVRRAGSGSGH